MVGISVAFLLSGMLIGILVSRFFDKEQARMASVERSRTEKWRSEWERVSVEMAELRGRTQDNETAPPAPLVFGELEERELYQNGAFIRQRRA